MLEIASPIVEELRRIWAWWVLFSGSPAFPVILYAIFGIYKFIMSIARFSRFAMVQREWSFLFVGLSNLSQSFALVGSALLVAPHPRFNFTYLVPHVRLAWALALTMFIVGTHFEGLKIARVINNRRDDSPVEENNDGNKAFLQE